MTELREVRSGLLDDAANLSGVVQNLRDLDRTSRELDRILLALTPYFLFFRDPTRVLGCILRLVNYAGPRRVSWCELFL